ncbi:MAG: BrnT family toxin [Bryobacterales bacterium]|nr:BrnT family toxin [Bryobacterales bacterium]
MEFIWDAANARHLGRRKITPQGAEETILLDSLESEFQHHADEQRVLCFGRTATGRLLTIIYAVRGKAVRVVTGYPMTKSRQRVYFKEK